MTCNASTKKSDTEYELVLDAALNRSREDFLVYLTVGDYNKCLDIALEFAHSKESFMAFCLQIVQPCMYELGKLWEEGELSDVQEQLAIYMVDRFISYLYSHLFIGCNSQRLAMVIAAPDDRHDMGARIAGAFFEIYGWRVAYSCRSLFGNSFLDKVKKDMPDVILIWVTMSDHMQYITDLITILRDTEETMHIKIIAGGQACLSGPDLWKRKGADGVAGDAREAVQLANELIEQ